MTRIRKIPDSARLRATAILGFGHPPKTAPVWILDFVGDPVRAVCLVLEEDGKDKLMAFHLHHLRNVEAI